MHTLCTVVIIIRNVISLYLLQDKKNRFYQYVEASWTAGLVDWAALQAIQVGPYWIAVPVSYCGTPS